MSTVSNPVPTISAADTPRPSKKLLAVSLAVALGLWVLWLLEDKVGEATHLTTLLLYIPQHPFGLLPLVLLWKSIRNRQKWAALINVLALAGFLIWLMGFNIPYGRGPVAGSTGSQQVRVMTYNTRFSGLGPERVASTIAELNPDVVCLQETTPDFGTPNHPNDRTGQTMKKLPGWKIVRAGEVATITRWPILSQRTYKMPRPNNRILLETQVKTSAGVLTVFNAHIGTASRGVKPSQTVAGRLSNIVAHSRASARTRLNHLPPIDAAIAGSQTPYVLAGDFNNPPRGHFYHHLSSKLTDAFHATGWGLGYTYPAKFPLLRIDYVWLGPGVRAERTFVPRVYSSDHRPIVADILLPAAK